MKGGLWGEYDLFDQLTQLEREEKQLASFRANKQSLPLLLSPISQTRLLLVAALVDSPPSHISHCTVGSHSMVNTPSLQSMLGPIC